jgi:FkbM family methyltransferase
MKNQHKYFLMDIGARGGISYPFDKMSNLSIILVEPDLEEAERLKALSTSKDVSILPYALWSAKSINKLNLTKSPGASSILTPNKVFLDQFPESIRFSITKEVLVECDTIDNLANSSLINRLDFIKIDVQGAELEILKGGSNFLRENIVGVELEVEFSKLYNDQPLFSEIDIFIREKLGLELWDISKTYWKYKNRIDLRPTKGKLVFGDALYMRPILGLDSWLSCFDIDLAKEKLIALIDTALLYGYIDYAAALIDNDEMKKYLDNYTKKTYQNKLNKLGKGIHISFKYVGYVYLFFLALANIFKPTHRGWASRGELHLGSKKKFGIWY